MHDRMTRVAQAAYASADALDQRRALYRFTSPGFTVNAAAAEHLNLDGSQSLLDVGCGSGDFVLGLARAHPTLGLIGLDLSAPIFDRAAKQAMLENLNVTLRQGDAASLPFADRSFGRATALHMLYHVPDIPRAIAELARVLRPDGRGVVSANSAVSKPVLRDVIDRVRPHLRPSEFLDTTERFGIERGAELLGEHFRTVRTHRYESVITLPSIEPYVAYFDSLRTLWSPVPTDRAWSYAMQIAEDAFAGHTVDGVLHDTNVFGVLVVEEPIGGR